MANPLFSTYSTPENRVTSTILAVFEKLNVSTVTRILQILIEDSTIELIEYENQIKSSDSIPDGRIKGLFDYIIETKVATNAIPNSLEQIENHCSGLKYDFSKLLILTPDFNYPEKLKNLNKKYNGRIIWGNFDKIIEGIDTIIEESKLLLDREKFLLLELKDFIINERLTAENYSRKALIVPASRAWPLYKRKSIYICQPNRTFQPSGYMGFYADGEIKRYFPQILGYIDNFNIQTDDLNDVQIITLNGAEEQLVKERLSEFKESLNSNEERNAKHKYIILTKKEDENTFVNNNEIINDKKSVTDKATAFVQKQTYLNIDELNGKRYTSELG